MGVAALWSGDLFTRARRFPNKDILIKDETQGNARKKEKSPEDAVQRCSLHVVLIPTSVLHQVGFVLDSPGREAWTYLIRATPTAQSHFLLLDLSFSLPHYPALLI